MQTPNIAPVPGPKEIVKQRTNSNKKQKKLIYDQYAIHAWPTEAMLESVPLPFSVDAESL